LISYGKLFISWIIDSWYIDFLWEVIYLAQITTDFLWKVIYLINYASKYVFINVNHVTRMVWRDWSETQIVSLSWYNNHAITIKIFSKVRQVIRGVHFSRLLSADWTILASTNMLKSEASKPSYFDHFGRKLWAFYHKINESISAFN